MPKLEDYKWYRAYPPVMHSPYNGIYTVRGLATKALYTFEFFTEAEKLEEESKGIKTFLEVKGDAVAERKLRNTYNSQQNE